MSAKSAIYRLVGPLCVGRVVRDLTPLNAYSDSIRDLASHYLNGDEPSDTLSQVVLCLEPTSERATYAHWERVREYLSDDGVLVLVCANELGILRVSVPPLADKFLFHRCYAERDIAATLYADLRYPDAQVAALHDGMRIADAHHLVHFYSNAPLPMFVAGVFELTYSKSDNAPVCIDVEQAEDVPEKADPEIIRRQTAVRFIERLMSVESRVVDLHYQNADLRRENGDLKASNKGASVPSEGAFDVPRTQHPWFRAQHGAGWEPLSDLYLARVDDPVIAESRAGGRFLGCYNLLDSSADISSALLMLTPRPEGLVLSRKPDVSIIIPVYGQLGYTLNCLDSLLGHQSRFTAEIIIIDDCSPDDSNEVLPQLEWLRYRRQAVNGGFISSCNAGGAMALGRFVVMLNNDTRVVEGWLDNLVGEFELNTTAGIVGSKLFYPDGSLQEAGGIVWRDGSAWNYGRGDDPNRPQYSYARDVDYCSGCSLAVTRELWARLGGFDSLFAPAYCEDVDLCFRVQQAGYSVRFQPQSRVIHYEGKTSGTDLTKGVKAYQVINSRKLFLRWRDKLLHHRRTGEAPFLERERAVRKHLLVVDATVPIPNQDAGSVQTALALRVCQALGYKTHFIPADNWLFQPAHTSSLQRQGIDCAYAPYEIGFDNYLNRYGWLFDVILVYRVPVLDPILATIRERTPRAVVLFHLADLHYLRLQRQAALTDDQELRRTADALKLRELALVKAVDCTITHSQAEVDILTKEIPGADVALWPLMIEHVGTKQPFENRRDLVFLGGYGHEPNVDAVLYFVEEILPLLREQVSELRLIVAGSHPTEKIKSLACDYIVVTGMVDNLATVFDQARVFVCPLRFGAGAKGKVASALSHGLPIVSTTVGVEGAGLTDGEHILIADKPADFAAAVLKLYNTKSLWMTLSLAGQQVVQERNSTSMGESVLAATIDRAFYRKFMGRSNETSMPPKSNEH